MMRHQEYNDACVARNAIPIVDEVKNEFDRSGQRNAWTKTHRLGCPICGAEFFAWEPADRPFEPYVHHPAHDGTRQTCGHPACVAAESKRALYATPGYQSAREKAFSAPELPAVKLTKKGEPL